jgi:TetR/AcrR family transcriptional regulator
VQARSSTPARARDAARTQESILLAAERLFAGRGYGGVSLQQVADAARVSRATPSYFFGSKERLYRAVLDRVFAPGEDFVAGVRELSARGAAPEAVLEAAIRGYIDFLAERPTMVRLIEWEAIGGGRFLVETAPHVAAFHEGLAVVAAELPRGHFRDVDPAQLLLSVVALCFFPFGSGDAILRIMGLDAHDPAFVEARKRHVTELLLDGLRPDHERSPGHGTDPAAPAA